MAWMKYAYMLEIKNTDPNINSDAAKIYAMQLSAAMPLPQEAENMSSITQCGEGYDLVWKLEAAQKVLCN